jgi:sialic acid synthase SpsE
MKIGNLDLNRDLLIIAEIGNNHEGDFAAARELVRRAAACGVQAVKFQTFQTRYFVSPRDSARFERLRRFELSSPQFTELQKLAHSLGLLFISTPLDLISARFLAGLVDCYKIASGDNNFYPLLAEVCGTGKPVILSTGLGDLQQVIKTRQFILSACQQRQIQPQLALLHCVSGYPVPPEEANLAAIPVLKARLGGAVGYSDHTLGVDACLAAVALGACIIEKHFTLDKQFSDFRDHQLSADPQEMRHLVEQAARIRVLLGTGEKVLQPCEAAVAPLARRSIAAAADLPAGRRLRWEDLTWLRPAGGLPPGEEAQLLGRGLKRAVGFGEPLLPGDVEEGLEKT